MSRAGRQPSLASLAEYWRWSRGPTYGVLLALPLLCAYELLAAAMNAGQPYALRNAADILVRRGLALIGAETTLGVSALLVVAGALIVVREQRRHPTPLIGRYFAAMLAESAVLALAFGGFVGALTGFVVGALLGHGPAMIELSAMAAAPVSALGPGRQLVLALGAGLYEELVFRVLLIPALAFGLGAAGLDRQRAVVVAAVLSALAFSTAHYLGPYGDPFALGSFTFRFIGGLAFSAILVLRGFGIVAWTHALYDVFLVASGA